MPLSCMLFGHKIQWRVVDGRYEIRCLRCRQLIKECDSFGELIEHYNLNNKPKKISFKNIGRKEYNIVEA